MIPFLGKVTKTIVLEVGEEWLRILGVLEQGRQRKIIHAHAEPIEGLSEVEISQKLAAFLKSKSFKPKKVIILHPSYNLTTRIMSLPSTDRKEIADILELQAVKQTPYTREEIALGFDVLDSKDGYANVLLAISQCDVASRYYRIAEMAGCYAQNITLSTQGVRHWFQLTVNRQGVEEGKVVMLLDIDVDNTEMLLVCGEKLLFARSLGHGSKHLITRDAIAGNFLSDIQRTMETALVDAKIEKVDEVVLTGAGKVIDEIQGVLSAELDIPCATFLASEGLERKIQKKALDVVKGQETSFVALVGMALDASPVTIDLIPSDVLMRKGLENQAKDLALLGTFLLAFMALVSAIGFIKVYRTTNYRSTLQEKYKEIQSESKEIERLVAKMKIAGEQMNQKQNFLDVMRDIADVIPKNIYLTSVQYSSKEKNTVVRGISEDMSSVFQFLSTLEAAPHLELVKTRNVTKRKIDERDVSEFEIIATLEGAADSAEEELA